MVCVPNYGVEKGKNVKRREENRDESGKGALRKLGWAGTYISHDLALERDSSRVKRIHRLPSAFQLTTTSLPFDLARFWSLICQEDF